MAKRIYKLSGSGGKVIGSGSAGSIGRSGTSFTRRRFRRMQSPLLGTIGGFNWSGRFDNFAADTTELLNWLGLDGNSVKGVDIGDISHLYNATVLSPLDEGTDAKPVGASDLNDNDGTIVTDPNYGGGSRNLIQYDNHLVQGANSGGTFLFPTPADGTRSFIIGMILQIDALSGIEPNVNIVQAVSLSPTRGWYLSNFPGDDRLQGVSFWGTDPFFQSSTTVLDAAPDGVPLLVLFNYDFAAGLKKIITPNGIVSQPLFDLGDFSPSVILKLGDPGITNWDGAEYTWAQLFMFDYDGTLDAQLSFTNMQRFLKFTDGILT